MIFALLQGFRLDHLLHTHQNRKVVPKELDVANVTTFVKSLSASLIVVVSSPMQIQPVVHTQSINPSSKLFFAFSCHKNLGLE